MNFLKNINRVAIYIIVFFVFFDGIRSNLIGGNYLSLVREAASWYLIGYTCLVCPQKRQSIITIPLVLFIIYHIGVSVISVVNEGPLTWSFVIKPFELIGMILVFDNYCELTNGKYRDLVRTIVLTAVAFGIVNILLYYKPLPIWNREGFWWGRISCGYPTMDVISLCYALVLLLHYRELRWKNRNKILLSVLLIIFIILNFSGTGTALLLLIMTSSLFVTNSRKIAGSVVVISVIVFMLSLASIKEFFPKEYSKGMTLLEIKYKNLMNDKSADANTLDVRERQFEKIERRIDNFVVDALGIGLNYATNDNKILNEYDEAYMIENEYNLLRICYGYVGFVLFLSFILHFIMYGLKTSNVVGLLGGGNIYSKQLYFNLSSPFPKLYTFSSLLRVSISKHNERLPKSKYSYNIY